MCGIFGFMLKEPLLPEDIQLGKEGMSLIHHRGPDDSGFWVSEQAGVFIGHTRLSIIDPTETSHQPVVRDNQVLAYNGELYNFKSLRLELENAGAVFESQGDTEVLFQAWRTWGAACLDKFDGMYAFALYQDGMMHLVTDLFGEKPLYWAKNHRGIYFCSEPGPLVSLMGTRRNMSRTDIAGFLGLGFVSLEHTGYEGVFKVPPATYIQLKASGIVSKKRYWELPVPQDHHGKVQPLTDRDCDRIEQKLVESLEGRVYADVPVGLFLSSGTDSSLIAALAAKQLNIKLNALTVSFADGRDESQSAGLIAQHLGLNHTLVDSQQDAHQATPEYLFNLYGELNDNLTAVSVRQMSELARAHFKVALCGTGGDELFFGYGRYQATYQSQHFLDLPSQFRRPVGAFLAKCLVRPNSWRMISQLCALDSEEHMMLVRNFPAGTWLNRLPEAKTLAKELFVKRQSCSALDLRYFDLMYTLPSSYIPAIERGSMRASMEVRTPFLNRGLLELLAEFDQRALLAFGPKSILKRLLRRYLPQHLVDQPKKGFVFPAQRYLQDLSDAAPQLEGVPANSIDRVWRRRFEPGWQKFAVRLSLLQPFMQN